MSFIIFRLGSRDYIASGPEHLADDEESGEGPDRSRFTMTREAAEADLGDWGPFRKRFAIVEVETVNIYD